MTIQAEQSHTRTRELGHDWFANVEFFKDGSSILTLRNSEIGQRVTLPATATLALREFFDAARAGTLL